jgi:hypothetical protein
MVDTATSVTGDVTVNDDGTWSYTWSWIYIGAQILSDVHEEFLISRANGSLVDAKREGDHLAEPGQNYVGGGFGNNRIPPGETRWALNVIQGGRVLGTAGGTFFAATPSES